MTDTHRLSPASPFGKCLPAELLRPQTCEKPRAEAPGLSGGESKGKASEARSSSAAETRAISPGALREVKRGLLAYRRELERLTRGGLGKVELSRVCKLHAETQALVKWAEQLLYVQVRRVKCSRRPEPETIAVPVNFFIALCLLSAEGSK